MIARHPLKTSTIIWIAFGALLFVFVYIKPVTLLLLTRWKARANPEFWMVPRPLADVSIERTAGRTFRFYGYQFEVPWTDVKREEHLKRLELVFFSNGFVLILRDPAQSLNQLEFLTRSGIEDGAGLKKILGEEATASNYALRSKILNLTPHDLQLSFSRQKMVSSSVLLMLKPTWTSNLRGGLYSFHSEWLRGFQQGDPTRDKTVTIDAFDAQDREIELSVGQASGVHQDVTQSELNRIISSLRPISATQAE
jgi:hypothetical protein